MFLSSLYAMFATLGFALLFNARGSKNLLFVSIGGFISWFSKLYIEQLTGSDIFSYFAASFIVGIYSEIMARILKVPVTVFIIAAMIPLVPGGGMYHTLRLSLSGESARSLQSGIDTLMIAGAIAFGFGAITSLNNFISRRLLKKNN